MTGRVSLHLVTLLIAAHVLKNSIYFRVSLDTSVYRERRREGGWELMLIFLDMTEG